MQMKGKAQQGFKKCTKVYLSSSDSCIVRIEVRVQSLALAGVARLVAASSCTQRLQVQFLVRAHA